MNLQERLLQSEIKHLGQIIQTLSYELIVLQDFLKDEHGSKFERFRANYASENSSTSLQTHQRSHKRSSLAKTGKNVRSDPKQDSSDLRNMDTDESEENDDDNNGLIPGIDPNESDAAYNDTLSDSDTSLTLKDPLDTESNEERKGGRKKTKIWKYFDKVTHRNNKFSARCHICRCLVSSRASRMVEHRLKCKRSLQKKPVPKDTKKHYAKEVRKEMKTMKTDGHERNGVSDQESCSDNQSDSDDDDKISKKHGRTLDTIWNYYEVVYQYDLRKAKCLSCCQFVSPKAVRMRQHKIGCKGSDGADAGTKNKREKFENAL